MDGELDLRYSDEALLSRVLYLASSTKLNIFVQDYGKEYEYEEIFERLFSDELKINLIFPTGGKLNLEEAYQLFGKADEYGKCFFIADGDFDKALRREQIDAPNFIYLSRYNIESYLIEKSAVIKYMRPKLKKTAIEVEKIVNFEFWESEIFSFLKKIFALFFIIQSNNINIENVSKAPAFFYDKNGLPNEENYNNYLLEVKTHIQLKKDDINKTIAKLENIYGKDNGCFICGKYCIESLSKYLASKICKKNIDCKEFRAFLIANFDVEILEYVREKLYSYILL